MKKGNKNNATGITKYGVSKTLVGQIKNGERWA